MQDSNERQSLASCQIQTALSLMIQSGTPNHHPVSIHQMAPPKRGSTQCLWFAAPPKNRPHLINDDWLEVKKKDCCHDSVLYCVPGVMHSSCLRVSWQFWFDGTNTIDCLERYGSEMTRYVSSKTLISRHLLLTPIHSTKYQQTAKKSKNKG